MTYTIAYSDEVTKTLKKYKKSNPQLLRKFQDLSEELMEHPRTGRGHPEPLRKGSDIRYSRRLSAHIRMIYDVYDETVIVSVISIDSHYNDK